MKETYKEAENKRGVQDIVLTGSTRRLIGLGGPDIIDYVNIVRSKGFEDITIYEKDYNVYKKQIAQFPDCTLIHGNILDHLDEDAFYDLDFCGSIKSIQRWLPAITALPEYALTCSIRPIGEEETIGIFNLYDKAHVIKYRDTSQMLVFFNNKTIKNGKNSRILQSERV